MPSLDADPSGLPTTTRSGIPYEIESLTYLERWAPAANQTVVTARVLGDQAWDFVTDMVGRAYFSGGTLCRDLPEQNPFDEKQYCLRCEQVDQGGSPPPEPVEPDPEEDEEEPTPAPVVEWGGPTADPVSGWPLPGWVRYRLTFEAPPFQMRSDTSVLDLAATIGSGNPANTARELLRYVIRERQSHARECQIPGGSFKTIDDATPLNRHVLMQTAFRVLSFADVTYQWVRVPVANLPIQAWKDCEGKINSTALDTGPEGYKFPAGTILFVGPSDKKRYWDANEDWVCDPVLSFRFNAVGWNNFLNNAGTPVAVSLDGTSSGAKPYTAVDLHDVFVAEAAP